MTCSCGQCNAASGGDSGHENATGPRPWLILALAILGLALFPFAVVASILGAKYRRRAERGALPENSAARMGFVLGAAGTLLGMIQVATLLYLLPVLIDGTTPETDRASALSTLHRLHQIQEDYRRLTGSYAPTLEMLAKRGFLKRGFTEIQNYRLEMDAPKHGGSFEARAISLEPDRPSYYVDQTGLVRESDNPEVGPESPPVEEAQKANR